jgi:hypothetical protein
MTNPSNINQGGAQNREHQPKEQTGSKQEVSRAEAGDARTPDKTIGQMKYADGQKKNEGGAGKQQGSQFEPEKQGGIGGP